MQKRQRLLLTHIGFPLCSIILLLLPKCLFCAATEKTVVNKEEYVSATVNATIQDVKGNANRIISNEDGRYGQNSPKIKVKGIIITPSTVNGGESGI